MAPGSNAVAASATSESDGGTGAAPGAVRLVGKPIPFPNTTSPAFLDYIVYERSNSRVWVPVGSTGSVDVLDTKTGTFTRIDGFKTGEREARGKKRTELSTSATARRARYARSTSRR
jgi:hypothetical protein